MTATDSGSDGASAWLTVDLGAIAANYDLFRNMAGPGCLTAAVVKADAYGLGAGQVVAALENCGCPFYFVATLDEALHLRRLTAKPVAVLGGPYRGAEDEYVAARLMPVLNSLADIESWRGTAERHQVPLPALVHFDTGMNRLGLGPDEAARLRDDPEAAEGLAVPYVMSHFACADETDHPMTARQCALFLEAAALFPAAGKSLANSSGVFRSESYRFDMIRPGMALYGLNPTPEAANPMMPVVRLEARVLQVRTVRKGESAGYGATFRFEKDARTATVALGYADGFLRSLGTRGVLYWNGGRCPIAGRVSMDTVIVILGDTGPEPRPGEAMEVIGPAQDADALAVAAGTIGYEILTGLGSRYHRRYVRHAAPAIV